MTRRCPDCEAVVNTARLRQSGREYCATCGLVLDDGRPDAPLYARGDLEYSALGGGV